jgi:RsiW-degrading membrane proteinase PrsW (M82 family)
MGWLDRYEKEAVWLLVGTFCWGAMVSVSLSFVLNMIGGPVLAAVVGEMFSGMVPAPVVEESDRASSCASSGTARVRRNFR